MLAVSHHKTDDRLPLKIWLKEGSVSEEFIKALSVDIDLAEAIYRTIYISFKNIIPSILSNFFGALIKIILVPFLLAIMVFCGIIYIVSVPICIYYLYVLNKKIIALKINIQKKISDGSISQKKLKRDHKNTVNVLEKINLKIGDKLKNEKIIKPHLLKMINNIKEIELIERVAAHPERNEIVLSYDELKELSIALKDFEPAEEQSNIYHS